MINVSNLLSSAIGLIGGRTMGWKPFDKKAQNTRGEFVNKYFACVEIYGSWQPVSNKERAQLGMKVSDVVQKLYVSANVNGIDRLKSPDVILDGAIEYEVIAVQDWYGQNGWKEVLCCRKT